MAVAQDFENAWGKVIFIEYRLAAGRYPPFRGGDVCAVAGDGREAGRLRQGRAKDRHGGNAGGIYQGWRICIGRCATRWGLGLGLGFSDNRDGWMNPSEFLAAHRGERTGKPLLVKVLAPTERAGWGTEY